MRKGEQTRAAILATACDMAAREGLEGLTIGALSARMRMSKSGVFAHFGSREDLQRAVLHAYEQRFVAEVLVPGIAAPRGLPRLQAIVEHWLRRTVEEAASACIWISGAAEYDDRPGPVRDELVAMVRAWQRELERAIRQAVDAGHLSPHTDAAQLIFELYAVMLAVHHDARLLQDSEALVRARSALQRVLTTYAQDPPPVARRVASRASKVRVRTDTHH